MDQSSGHDGFPPVAPAREPLFNIPAVVLGFIAVNLLIHLVREFALSQDQNIAFLIGAAFIPVRYSGAYVLDVFAFTSPVTYSLLHGSWAHLVVNMVWLAAFGSPLANRIGSLRFIAFWVLTALAAAALHYALFADSQAPLIGASGAVSGMMGAAARFGFGTGRNGSRAYTGPLMSFRQVIASRTVMAFLVVWFVVNLATGLGVGTDALIAWQAHIGGFLAGFLAISLFDPFTRLKT